MLGGDIEVESRPGCGSRFVVTIETGDLSGIPMELEDTEVLNPVRPQQLDVPIEQPGGSILLAEDGQANREVISYYLKKTGAVVTVAENGRVARSLAMEAVSNGKPFDVILMDMQMPELDGYEATASLRSFGYTGPIIALTAHAMAQDKDKCLACGCTDYLSKPIDRELMLATVSGYLKKPAAQEAKQSAGKGNTSGQTLHSTVADDADMAQFLQKYVADLPGMVDRLEALLKEQDIEQFKQLIHQIKGTGGFYGFMPLTEAAEQIEERIETGLQLDAIAADVESLVNTIRSVEGYDPRKEVASAS